jgi:hypothetical protein
MMAKPKKAASKQSRGRGASAVKAVAIPARRLQKHEFYSGLMLAVAASGQTSFDAEGPSFYEGFLRAVERARNDGCDVEGIRSMTRDPVFGVVHQANEMLVEAEEDRIIALLNPQLKEARFKISQAQAAQELAASGEHEWFRTLALEFVKVAGQNKSASTSSDKKSRRRPSNGSRIDSRS